MRCPEIYSTASSSSCGSADELFSHTFSNASRISSEFDTSTSSLDLSPIRGSRKRKSFSPRRSSPIDDPNFRGVTVYMENKFVDNEWRLMLQTKYSLSPKRRRKFSAYVESSEDEEPPVPPPPPSSSEVYTCPSEEKHCASCSAVKTPLWRDAEDGTPLCNACGIRYKKYKLRCGMCWHIPKKDEFSPCCCSCGSLYQHVSPRR